MAWRVMPSLLAIATIDHIGEADRVLAWSVIRAPENVGRPGLSSQQG
jgi:hypothetical protein